MSTTFSDGTRVPGTRRNEALFRQLRTARQISASKTRRHDRDRSVGRQLQSRPRLQDQGATFGFNRLLDVLGHMLPGGAK